MLTAVLVCGEMITDVFQGNTFDVYSFEKRYECTFECGGRVDDIHLLQQASLYQYVCPILDGLCFVYSDSMKIECAFKCCEGRYH